MSKAPLVIRTPTMTAATSIQTQFGKYFDFTQVTEYEYDLNEAVHAVCNICRFNGHTSRFYSVGEHTLLGEAALNLKGTDPRIIRSWLLHDLHEAYVGDIPLPLKRTSLASGLVELEERVQAAFLEQCAMPMDAVLVKGASVEYNDVLMLCYEVIHLMDDDSDAEEWSSVPRGYFEEARKLPNYWATLYPHGSPRLIEEALLRLFRKYDLL